jgi:hypothetical protein
MIRFRRSVFGAPCSRRQWLRSAGLGCGALALADLLAREATASGQALSGVPHFEGTARNVIWLFMHGGPSQVDTFDPKPALEKYDGSTPPSDYHELDFQFTNV